MSKPVININEVELLPRPPAFAPKGAAAERYDARMGFIAPLIGAQKLGCNITAVPPGKRAFPFHNHHANEEMVYVLEGTGEVRIGDATYRIRAGDIVALPPGGQETAHQVVNTSQEELKYLAVSTRTYPEVVEYPDSGKFGMLSNTTAGADGKPRDFRFVGRMEQSVDYWEGE